MTADFQRAAKIAMETLIKYHIDSAPVIPLPIFKKTPGVLVLSFAEMSDQTDIDRNSLVAMFGGNQDAATFRMTEGNLKYIVAYNQRLPFYLLQRSLSRELGHIMLGHDGSRPVEVRTAEAYCFAHHLLCPRPLIHAIQQSGIRLTVEVLGNITGCYERCLAGIRREPGVYLPPDLNRAVRDQFSEYIRNFLDFQPYIANDDQTAIADFGQYMDNYGE